MTDKADLNVTLSRLAEMLPREASAAVEQRLLAVFRVRRRRSQRMRAWWASTAACLALASGWFWLRPSAPSLQPAFAANDAYYAAMAGFTALPYAQSDVPLEEAVIVRVDLQRSELGRLGVPVTASNASGKVSADLLIGQDGIARAVRLVD